MTNAPDTSKVECGKSRKSDDSFSTTSRCVRLGQKTKLRVAAERSPSTFGQRLEQTLRLAELEQEVGRLTKAVTLLTSLLDTEELAAAARLREISPTNAQLKLWASESTPPEDLVTQQEERPW